MLAFVSAALDNWFFIACNHLFAFMKIFLALSYGKTVRP
jgi:hypothetical protein